MQSLEGHRGRFGERARRLLGESVMISLHDHLGLFPEPVTAPMTWLKRSRSAGNWSGMSVTPAALGWPPNATSKSAQPCRA